MYVRNLSSISSLLLSTIFPYLFPFLFILQNNLPFKKKSFSILPWINLFMKCFLFHVVATSLTPFYDLSTFTWSPFPFEFELTLKVCLAMSEYLHLVHLFMMCQLLKFHKAQPSTLKSYSHISWPNQAQTKFLSIKGSQKVNKETFHDSIDEEAMTYL